jgi:cytochrome c556
MHVRGRLIGGFVGAILIASAGLAQAEDQAPADIIKARQQHLKDLGGALKAIGDQLKSGAPDKAVTVPAAQKAAELAKDLPNWFPAGTGPEAGVKTRAKPEIWTKPADFKMVADKLSPETDKLAAVVASGDVAAIGAQLQATGKACHACHEDFRVKKPGE